MTSFRAACCVLVLGVAFGCGEDHDGEHDTSSSGATHGGGHDGTGGTGAAGGGDVGGNGTGGSGPVEAPTLDSVAPLEGGLHVTWTNNTTDCDMIELDRNENAGAFTNIQTFSGAAESYHDGAASTGTTNYCYKLRCLRGQETSADSNEKCAMP